MPSIIQLQQIKAIVKDIDIIAAMKAGFIAYSQGNAVVPPVGELILEDPPGDVHIKYGYIKKEAFYVVKIASGFYENPKLGIASSQGMMLLFKQQTGELAAVLLDEGYLTDIRTAAAGALVVQHFAPKNIKAVGIIGTGTQAKLQLLHMQEHNPCQEVWLWGRNQVHAERLKADLGADFNIHIAESCAEVAQHANVVITTTPAEKPLLRVADVQPGTLIIAVGSDTQHKQELDSYILQKADIVIGDSIPQSKNRGEIYQATKAKVIDESKVVELGNALQDVNLQGINEQQIIVVDLTGVAVQDIKIATAVYNHLNQ